MEAPAPLTESPHVPSRDALVRALLEAPGETSRAHLLAHEPGGSVLVLAETGGPLFVLAHPGPATPDADVARHARQVAESSQAPLTHVVIVGGGEGLHEALRAARPLRFERKVAYHRVAEDGSVWSSGAPLRGLREAARRAAEAPPGGRSVLSSEEVAEHRARFRRVAEAERAFAAAVSRRQPVVTWALLGLNGLLFGLELLWGGSTSGATLQRMGANGAAALAGEPWRVLSSAFLHRGPLHLALNMFGVWMLGGFLERVLGPARFTLLYALSALAGGVASAALSSGRSVGASGALFGLLAATLSLAVRPGVLPPATRARLRSSLTSTLVANVTLSFLPGIDLYAHFGGAAAGASLALSGLLTRRGGTEGPGRWRRAATAAGLLMAGALALALAAGRPWELGRPPELEDVALGPLTVALPAGLPRQVSQKTYEIEEIVAGTLDDDGLVIVATASPPDGSALDALADEVARELPEGARFASGPAIVPVAGRPTFVASIVGRQGVRSSHWATELGGRRVRVSVVTEPETAPAWAAAAGEVVRSLRLREAGGTPENARPGSSGSLTPP